MPACKDQSKQVIVVRRDLDMPAGKMAAQVAHASMAFLTNRLRQASGEFREIWIDPEMLPWIEGSFTKVVLMVPGETELLDIHNKALTSGCRSVLITDEGRTVFDEPTNTCVGIGPNSLEKINAITGHLRLYR
jgi:peptidyl-tRNA hydrolase